MLSSWLSQEQPPASSLIPTGYFGNSSENILIYNDLLSQSEIDKILHACKNLDIWHEDTPYRNKYHDPNKLKLYSPEVYELINEVTARWHEKIESFFNVKVKAFLNPLCKWPVGGSQKPHADKEWEDGSPGEQNFYDIGSVIYINDDYLGGEIFFDVQNICLKPKAGSAAAFPGDMLYLHGVHKIQNTERYTMPIFWTVQEYEKNKDKNLLSQSFIDK